MEEQAVETAAKAEARLRAACAERDACLAAATRADALLARCAVEKSEGQPRRSSGDASWYNALG